MRIETLTLERYGRFQDFSLDLSGSHPCLHIIHGANEAGKSTALSAICDLLFGIGARTPYGFAHGYDSLRIGATLSTAAGQSLTLWRRKGNRNTLLDASGAALPDDILAPFRGGLGREDFERRALRGRGERVRVLADDERAVRAVTAPVIANRLRDGENVRLGKCAVERRAAMTAGAEADELVCIGQVRLARVILAFESREIHEHGLGRGFASKR